MTYRVRRWRRVSTQVIGRSQFYATKNHVIPGRFKVIECVNLLWLQSSRGSVYKALFAYSSHPIPRRRVPVLELRNVPSASVPIGAIRMFDHLYTAPVEAR
jgi:hypothetical protein